MSIATDDIAAILDLPKGLKAGDSRLVASALMSMRAAGTDPSGLSHFYRGRVSQSQIRHALLKLDAMEPDDSPELVEWRAKHPYKHYSPRHVAELVAWLG